MSASPAGSPLSPLPARRTQPAPTPGPPSDSTQAPYLGKDTKSGQSAGAAETFSACFGDGAGGAGRAAAGKRREKPFMDRTTKAFPLSGLGAAPSSLLPAPESQGRGNSRGSGPREGEGAGDPSLGLVGDWPAASSSEVSAPAGDRSSLHEDPDAPGTCLAKALTGGYGGVGA